MEDYQMDPSIMPSASQDEFLRNSTPKSDHPVDAYFESLQSTDEQDNVVNYEVEDLPYDESLASSASTDSANEAKSTNEVWLQQLAAAEPLPLSPPTLPDEEDDPINTSADSTTFQEQSFFENEGPSPPYKEGDALNTSADSTSVQEQSFFENEVPPTPLKEDAMNTSAESTYVQEQSFFENEGSLPTPLKESEAKDISPQEQSFFEDEDKLEANKVNVQEQTFFKHEGNITEQEEKRQEDEELGMSVRSGYSAGSRGSVRSTTSRVSSYGRTTTVTYATETFGNVGGGSVRDRSLGSTIPATIGRNTNINNEESSTDASTTEPTSMAATDEESGIVGAPTERNINRSKQHKRRPSSIKTTNDKPQAAAMDVELTENEDDDDDDDSTDYEHLNKQRAKERQFGCVLFQTGFIGVLIAVILLGLQITRQKQQEQAEAAAAKEDPILTLLALPSDSTTLVAMKDPLSPQGRAYHWMKQDPWLDGTYSYTRDRARQRMGLATLYYATKGSSWDDSDENYFLSYDRHECDWLPNNEEYKCNVRYQLTSLGLKNMNLRGTLPPETWLLIAPNSLEHVLLADNDLQGTIGTEIGAMIGLSHLDLSQNRFSGSLPKEIGRCQQLQALVLNSLPLLEGTIPPELVTLRSLKGLWWRDTAVRGSIPSELAAIPSLQVIDLSGNLLRGTLPEELFVGESGIPGTSATARSLPQKVGLKQIRVSHNRLIGTIPPMRGRILNTLETLDVTSNHLESTTLPTHLSMLNKLTSLQVGSNSWTGPIPTELALLSTNLQFLGLQDTEFVGPVPTNLLQLTQLQALYLHDNPGLSGTIVPEEDGVVSFTSDGGQDLLPLAKLQYLKELTISNTPLIGELPNQVCVISILSFTCNPQELCGCDCECVPTKKEDFVAITTEMPSASPTAGKTEATILTDMPSASQTEAMLTDVPSAIPTTSSTDIITASPSVPLSTASPTTNPWSILVPSESSSPPTMISPSTPSPTAPPTTNPWSIFVPSESSSSRSPTSAPTAANSRAAFVANLPDYTKIGLDLNPVDGPQALALDWLFADPNVLSYSLTRKVQRFAMSCVYYALYGVEAATQETVWLNYNTHECFWSAVDKPYATCATSSSVTSSEGGVHERYVRGLFLDSAGLVGSLPPEIALFSNLVSLQGSNSNMGGTIPTEVGLLANMQTLRIPGNQLEGPLPTELGMCTSLKRIHLGSNKRLNGPLPSELVELTGLQTLVVSQNALTGNLPDSLPSKLQILDLSANKFSGTLPIASWVQSTEFTLNFRKLRISQNDLVGPLGTEMGRFTRLSELDISQNRFKGALPLELGLCAQLSSLDVARNEFDGSIPASLGRLVMLRNLHLNSNSFTGTIPSQSLAPSLTDLEELTLHNNTRLVGRIPDSFTSLTGLEVLTVNATGVAGRIPPALCFLEDFSYTCSNWLCGCRDCPCEKL